MSKLRRYWPEITVFGVTLGVLVLCCAPDLVWVNTDCDGPHYIFAAKYLYPAHKTSAPLFLLLGHLFLYIPHGTDAWRMGMLSVLASTATAAFTYLCIRHHVEGNRGRWYGLVGALIWGSSALVISQSTIVESYALVTLFGAGAYYFSLKKRWVWTAVFLGLGMAVHPLAVFPLAVIFVANRELRKWRYYGITAAFLIFYIYIPLTNRPPYMWLSEKELGTAFFIDNINTITMLVGGQAIWDLPKKLLDTIGIMGVSLGLGVIVLPWWLWKTGRAGGIKGLLKQPLLWLFALPAILYVSNVSPQTYVYCLPSIAWGAIIAGIMLPRMKPYWGYAAATVAIGLLAFNANYFDIGRTLDPELSARKFYNEELPKVSEDDILLTARGWEWAMVFLYNAQEGKNLTVVCEGVLPSTLYQDMLKEQGIKLVNDPSVPLGMRSLTIAQSIMELNDNVLVTAVTTPRTYGARVVPAPADGNAAALDAYRAATEESASIQWKPSNPYDIITGAIEIEEWIWIVFSNYSVLSFTMMGTIGAVPLWILYTLVWKRKRWSWRKVLGREREVEA